MTRRPLWRRLLGWWARPCRRWPACAELVECSAGERQTAERLANRYSAATLREALRLEEERRSR